MLDLSRCTLLFVETRAHDITQRVVDQCREKATFGDVLIYTDAPDRFDIPGARYELVPDWDNKKAAGGFYYQHACAKINTDFALMLEWDGGIYDATKWKPEFFDYDYIGAPWVVRPDDTQDVGNGGFTLMSKRLGVYLDQHKRDVPVYTDWDLCRNQRPKLEQAGFKWPDARLASFFSWELGERNPDHFGYHGAFTWPYVLSRDELVIRAELMLKTPYLASKMKDLMIHAPWLDAELGPEKMQAYFNSNPAFHPLSRPPHRNTLVRLARERRDRIINAHDGRA